MSELQTDLSSPRGAFGRLVGRVFPKTPDFYGLLKAQSEQAVRGMETLVEYMSDGSTTLARAVKRLESESDEMRDRSMAALNSAFSTPMDREDLYRAIATLDHLLGYAKSTVREMEVLHVDPDRHTRAMAEKLYRKALSDLFDVESQMKSLGKIDGPSGPATLAQVIDIFKRREIYRHLSNAGDRVAHAGESLHDIIVKLV
jgi:uncharacterized protein Yka (UPF0111/DUF47 family)